MEEVRDTLDELLYRELNGDLADHCPKYKFNPRSLKSLATGIYLMWEVPLREITPEMVQVVVPIVKQVIHEEVGGQTA